mmetsp:Transcript_341/g.667  ORF Transcript_341/g.667 Transcript_341/m.667 type:complete len:116 (-) Transcript_341:115-462(-)
MASPRPEDHLSTSSLAGRDIQDMYDQDWQIARELPASPEPMTPERPFPEGVPVVGMATPGCESFNDQTAASFEHSLDSMYNGHWSAVRFPRWTDSQLGSPTASLGPLPDSVFGTN